MDVKNKHTITDICIRYLGIDNVIAIWRSTWLSERFGINYICAIVRDGRISDKPSPLLSMNFTMSVQATAKTGHITEIAFGDEGYHQPIRDDDEIIYSTVSDLSRYKEYPLPSQEQEDRKGYYVINSLVSSLLAEKYDAYEHCFERMRPRYENPKDTMYGTCHMLFYMKDNLPKDIVLDWFRHDTPVMQQMRHSSPFVHAIPFADDGEYDELTHYVVNHPDEYPPRYHYQLWLNRILSMGGEHINDFTRQYIPDDVLSNLALI